MLPDPREDSASSPMLLPPPTSAPVSFDPPDSRATPFAPGVPMGDPVSEWWVDSKTPEMPRPTSTPSRGRLVMVAAVTTIAAVTAAGAGFVGGSLSNREPDLLAEPIATVLVDPQTSGVSQQRGSVATAAARLQNSVVTVKASNETGAAGESGSGIVVRSDGYVVTNYHVVKNAENLHVRTTSGRLLPARLVGSDPGADVAVVKVSRSLPVASFADSDKARVGMPVVTVGSPLGLSNTVTEGIVSAVHRPVVTGDGSSADASLSTIDAIQTDAALNPGNSGGALADLKGNVIGMNTAIATVGGGVAGQQSGDIGVGFAIPSDTVVRIANQIVSTGHATRAVLGVMLPHDSVESAGAMLGEVSPGSPAAAAGLMLGDIVTRFDGRPIYSGNALAAAVRSMDPGATVELEVAGEGDAKPPRTVTVVLGEVRSE